MTELIARALLFTAGEEAGGVDTEAFTDDERAWMVAEAQRRIAHSRSGDVCPQCGGSMEGRSQRARYCSRACQTAALQERRKAGGWGTKIHLHAGEYGSGRAIPACGVYGWTETSSDPTDVTCEHCLRNIAEGAV